MLAILTGLKILVWKQTNFRLRFAISNPEKEYESCHERRCSTSMNQPTSNRYSFSYPGSGTRLPISISMGNRAPSNSVKTCRNWTAWSNCSKPCARAKGPGKKSRTRLCETKTKSGFSAYSSFKTETDDR